VTDRARKEVFKTREEDSMAITNQAPFSSYSITPNNPDPQGDNVGKVVSRNVIGGGISCAVIELLDISGFSVVPDTGNTTLRIRSLLCPDDRDRFAYDPPVNIVATPVSATPLFTTVMHSLIVNQFNIATDVEIHIFAWQTNGAPAPHVTVDWRCRVPVYKPVA
jgi:hypothetical protein